MRDEDVGGTSQRGGREKGTAAMEMGGLEEEDEVVALGRGGEGWEVPY